MKRYLFLLPALAIALSLTACGSGVGKSVPSSAASSSPAPEDPQSGSISQLPVSESDQDPPGSNILVAYFSWADNAVLDDDVDGVSSPSVIPPGNVQLLAGWVQEETGGDLFAIRVADPYPCGWDA